MLNMDNEKLYHHIHGLYMSGYPEDAYELLAEALNSDPDSDHFVFLRSLFDRYENKPSKQWREGFSRGFLCGLRHPDLSENYAPWMGQPVKGKKILVVGDQGLGDQIRWSRHLAAFENVGAIVTVLLHPKIVSLVSSHFPALNIQPMSVPFDPQSLRADIYDYIIPLGDLDGFLNVDGQMLPNGFLTVDAPLRQQAAVMIREAADVKFNVGICYRSSFKSTERNIHYVDLEDLRPVLQVKKCNFFSLQCHEQKEDVGVFNKKHGAAYKQLENLDVFNDIETVSACISQLDLVISTTSFVADIASALGVPAWRFQTGVDNEKGDANPWYGATTKMYYRSKSASWQAVFEKMAQDLISLVDK